MILAFLTTFTIVQNLDFGEIALMRNHQKSELTVKTSGEIISSGAIYIFTPGHAAELLLQSSSPQTELQISALVTAPMGSAFASNTFNLIDLNYPSSVVTDSSGMATITLGGTIQSSGNGVTYQDSHYQTSIAITVTY
ncbi:DUF4402 domain-containing protein [Pseudoalteromonas fenneropenaei]|uniref:DUF4402 domain-containing protein n=1 Tax=Pseudoalteromonas fenneropenaei TaxID=1737459 RepID=A0ABV7CGS9_9GAMM